MNLAGPVCRCRRFVCKLHLYGGDKVKEADTIKYI